MAEFWVQNSLNYNKAVKFNITLRYIGVKSEGGAFTWVLEIGTTYLDASGDDISAAKIHNVSVEDLDEIIEDALAGLCVQIDWSPLVQDKEPPYVDSVTPTGSGVSLYSDVVLVLKDLLPSAGIDISNLKVTLNNSMTDFDITSEVVIEGDPYGYTLKWAPAIRVRNTYD